MQSIKENEKAVAEAEREVAAWKAIVGEKARREEAAKAEAERIATEKAEAERKAAEERERAEKEEKARIEAEKKEAERIAAEKAEEEARVEDEKKAEEERVAKQKAEKTAEAESDKEEEEKRMDDEEPKPVGSGVFGNIYNQFKGKVKEAFDFLMKHKGGDLLGVFHRKDVGDIDLVWGDHGGGLAHIIRRHIIEQNDFKNVDEIQKVIEDVIRNGLIVRENKDKINIEYNGYRVSIKKTIRDSKGNVVENKNWIVTAFDKSKPKHEKRNPSSSETLTTPSANQKADGVTLPSNEDSTDKGSEKPEKKQEKQSVFDKAKEIADKEEKKRKAEAEDDSALGQATRAVGKKKKVNLFKYTASEKNSYPTLRGVHYANGYAYASDGSILFKEKADYPKEWEGTIRDKNGNLIDGIYPDTEKAIHRLVHILDKEVESLPSKEVLDFAIAASKKLKGEAIPVAIDGIFFNAVNLKKFLEAVASKGMDKVVYRHPMLYATNGKDEIVMMPTVNTLEGTLDIADKMERAGLPKEQIDAWKAHIEAADKKMSFEDFQNAEKNAKRKGVRLTEAESPKRKADERYQRGEGGVKPSKAEVALRDAVIDRLRESGMDVIADEAEGQRVLDEVNGRAKVQMGDAPETFAERQKQAVESHGVVMPGLNESYVEVVKDIPRHEYTGSIAEATREAIDAAKRKYAGKELTYNNYGANFNYTISANAIDICLSPKHQNLSANKGIHLALAEHLDEVINKSVEVEEHPDYIKGKDGKRGEEVNPNAIMHRFYGVAVIDGTPCRVMTLMREDGRSEEANGVHSYEVQKIEVLDNESPSTSNGVGTQMKDLSAYPLAKLLKGVEKSYDKGKYLLDESKKRSVGLREQRVDGADGVRFFRTANGEAYGFTVGGRIYIDPRIATSETPVHEYAHLWAEALRNGNPKEWQNVVELMKGTKVWDEVKARYPELKSDDEIADEVIATYSGRRGAERLREEQRKIAEGNGGVFEKAEAVNALERVKQALKKFWNGVADFLHIHYKSAEEVADRVMKDLLEGVDPRKMGKTKDGGVRFSAKQKRALETASLGNVPRSLTVVSSAAGANVLNNIENLAKEFEKSATQPKTFIGDVAKALGASRFGSGSEYATFETKNGNIVTIRLANHNAHVSGFDHNDKDNGISIVISPKPNEGITNDGNAHITEFYYDSIKLRRAEGKPLAEIVRSIKQALYSGEFKDTTGLAERQEVNGEDVIRYQSSSENSDKTLAGVHNITEEKLRKALKLGGLANPSVAVIDISKNSHEGFGEISLILPSEKVAKRTGKNAGTWQGDAWTPTYPQIERRMSNKGAEKASKDVLSVPSDMYSEVRIGLDRWLDSGEANSAMAYMFLHEKGVAPEPKKIQPKFSDEAYNELKSITAGNFNIYGISKADAQKVLAMYIDAYFDGDKDLYEDKTKAWLEKNRSIVDAGDKGGMRYAIAKENVKLYDEYGFNYRGVQTFVRDVEYDHRNTGVDMNATLNEVEDYIKTNSLTDEFNTWQEGKEKEYGIKEVIFDGFTPSGNRRYIPNTLENVSKIMKKQGRNGATGAWASFPNFAARLMPSYGTLEDIRSKKGLLTSDREKIDDFREMWSKVFFELGMKCQPDATGTFDDYGFDRLSEAAMTSDPQAFLKQEYNVDFSDEDTKRLKKMVKAIKEEYPAMYFETKFERPVYLNEFAAVVVPNDLGADVKKALSDLGIAMYEYDASKEGDRSRAFDEAVKSSGKIRFQFIGEKGAAEADHAEEVFANENVERSVRESGDEPENKRRKDFAERFGVDESYVSDYANGMAQKNTGKAARARRSMERQIYLANAGKTSKLSDIAKSLKSFRAALKEAFGDLDALIDEYRKLFEEERNMMEAARKKAEDEAAARKRHLDELSLLTDGQIDSRYAEALEKGDETEAREMLDEVARRKGYGDENNEYRMQHRAPSNPGYESDEARRNDIENGPDVNLEDIALGYNRQPDDYFTNPRGYGNDTPHGRESTDAVANALSSIRQGGRDVTVKVYRAVPTTMKEGKLRNGDWVTLSRRYAEMHGNHALNGKYRIMEDEVPAKDIWWDGNDVNEFGYDNGEDYKYKNVKNNRKSDDLVTRDDKGNVIPPSKRFNQRKADERYSRRESKALTAEERELRDNLVERMRKGGLDVVTDSEEMQRVIDAENERTRNKRSKKSEAARKRDEALYAVDWSTAFVSGKSREEATEIRRERGRKFKEETKELYGRVLSGNFDDVTLRLIDEFIDKSTPNNPYERPISKRLPTRALQKMRGGERTGSVDALFSRICESAVGKDGKTLPRAERERAIEEKKKELLKKWAIATGNWHTDVSDFSDGKEPIGSGTDSDVYLSKDGKSVIKVSKGKPYGKRFRPDVDNVALFNTVFPGSRYTIEGYGEIDGKFVRFLKQPFVDFSDSTPLTEGERVAYMEKLGFKPINKENTAFSNGEIVASDLQKSNVVRDRNGNVRVIDADMKLHTKDVGGNYSYPDVETDTTSLAEREEVNTGSVREHRVYHGSGADFDAFDHSHMGEGEGAQAYGWGTYVTEVEGIGRTYAIQNSKYAREYPVYNGDSHGLSEGRINEILEVFLDGVSDETYILRAWDDAMQWYSSRKDDDYAQSLVRDASLLNPSDISIAGSKTRNLYTVEIPDDNGSNYLDWNGHPAESLLKDVGSFLESNGFERVQDSPVRYEKGESTVVLNPNATGADLYAELQKALGGDKKASQALAELGYTGIKYPADNMRGGRKDGAKNYVIFNENDAKITDHTRFLRTASGEVYGLVKDGRIYLDPKVATSETAVHEYTHLWGDMLRRKDSEQWSHTVKELKNSVLWEEVKELYPELKTDDEIADEVLSTFSGRRGAERLREEARRVADGEGGVFTKAKAIETLERVKGAIARFWEGVARMFGINRYRSVEELADMAMKDLLDSKNPMKDESGMRKRGEVGDEGVKSLKGEEAMVALDNIFEDKKTENMPQKVSSLVKFMELFRKPVRTFLGEVVNVKEEVYNKIIREKRTSISGAVLPTLENADFAIRDTDGSTLYIKRFKSENNDNVYNIAVVNKYGEVEDYVSSVHIKSDNNLRNKITKGAELLLPQERITDGILPRNNPTPTANVTNISEPSKPRFSRKPGESIFDYASRVSEDVDRSVREIVSARDEYEKKVKSKGFQTKEALQNSMLGLQEFMSAIDHASGNKRYIEDIPDFENPILGENRLSSVNKEEMHQVAKTQFKPLMSAVAKLSGNGKESGELYDYMFAKHGLERDAVMRQREAQKEFDKYQKAHPKGTKTIGDFVASLEGKDYAGLTALTAEDGRVKSIQSQIDAIDEQMKATDDQLLLRYLGGQKKRLKVDLLNAARDAADDIRKAFENNPSHDRSDINELWTRVNEVNGNTLRKLYESGMLTKEAYDDISSMYTNYIPMRGFDQTTSADAYAYLTHGDSAFNAPIKTAKGRSSKADNPIAYMQAMAESAIMQGNRNVLVKQKMLNFVRNHPSDLASVSDVWLQYDSVADEWKPFYGFGRESKG